MSMSRSGWGTTEPGRRHLVVLACLLVSGCADAQRTGAAPVPAAPAADRMNASYTVTCDGIVPGGFRADVADGAARVPADAGRPPHYAYYDIRVTGSASGDVDGDGAPDTVVLLDCAPRPSNGVVQEVQLFSSSGRLLGRLPSAGTLERGVRPPPVYEPDGLSVQDGEIVAAMTAYGPEDSHATGPSVPLTVRWRFDGQGFVRSSS